MGLFAQMVFGCLGVFCAWTMIRALRTGIIFSRGARFDLDERPIAFSLVFTAHLAIVGLCFWIAAGYEPAEFLHLLQAPGMAAI